MGVGAQARRGRQGGVHDARQRCVVVPLVVPGTRVTEYWEDLRTGRGARLAELLGRVFTGTPPADRAELNRAGMRTTLGRIKAAVES
ncbi:hypothetical protein [Streptomyces sp. NPDC127084]|uniref:hypothetical protein n=1 Tax=Streptomyces sp. NPDC127084 TaxID=3347133 RepID=UPI00364A3A2C